MRGNVVETLIGAVVLVAAAAFLTFASSRADVGTVSGYELVAKFDRIDGLAVGSDVLVSGIKVGSITGMKLDTETFLAEVRISLDESIELPDDTSAEVASDGLLGDKYLVLVPGGSIDMLGPGDEIQYTQGSIDIIGLVGQAIFSSAGDKAEDDKK